MSKESELDFLLRRATEEIEYADLSHHPAAAKAHREMAELYARKVADYGTCSTDPIEPLSSPPMPMPQRSSGMR